MRTNTIRKEAIKSYRLAVDNLIGVLKEPIDMYTVFTDSDDSKKKPSKQKRKESDIRSELKSKKNAFAAAKNIMMLIYNTEKQYLDKINLNWFKDRSMQLSESAYDAIKSMCDMVGAKMPEGKLGGNEINASIDIRDDGANDIKSMIDGIDELDESIKRANKGEDMFVEEDKTYTSLIEDRSENGK